MPLASIQVEILQLLAAHRDPESFIAGSTPLNREAARYSVDIDVFNDHAARLAKAAEQDTAVLTAHGFALEWLHRHATFQSVVVARNGHQTRLEWVVDSDFRFFPAIPDALFGYRLHPVDLATNKAMAAAGRREPRDIVDLLTVHDTILSLGAVIWASVGKALGFTPEGLINEIRRLARYTKGDFESLTSDPAVEGAAIMVRLRTLLEEAEAFVALMPTDLAGLLFLEGGRVVQPDPARLADYATHEGRRRGAWPSTSEIMSAMLEASQPAP